MKCATQNETRDDLSGRERLAVRGLLEGLSATEALSRAGYSQSVAQKKQKEVFGRPRVRSAIQRALEAQGLTVDRLAKVLAEGLDAMLPLKVGKDVMEYPDHQTRLKYLQIAANALGLTSGIR